MLKKRILWIGKRLLIGSILAATIFCIGLVGNMSLVQNSLIETTEIIIDTQTILVDNMIKVDEDLEGIVEAQIREIGILVKVVLELEDRIEELEKDRKGNLEAHISMTQKVEKIGKIVNELSERMTSIEDMWDALNFGKFTATAYSPFDNVSGIENDGDPSHTATGSRPQKGTIAVDPEIIPYYSKMIIIGDDWGEHGIALDTGFTMRKHDYWIDIYKNTYQQTLEFGKQDVVVIWEEP